MQGTLGEIRVFGGNFAPVHWALCQGQLLTIADNNALYSLIGTAYGGDGITNFGLPDLRGRIALGTGTGPGLTPRPLGQRGGTESVQLTIAQMPNHNHQVVVTTDDATTHLVSDQMLAAPQDTDASAPLEVVFYLPDTPSEETILKFREDAITPAGDGAAHENRQPFVTVNYIICVNGDYPQFS